MECQVKDCPRHLMATNACELGRLDPDYMSLTQDNITCWHRKYKMRGTEKEKK